MKKEWKADVPLTDEVCFSLPDTTKIKTEYSVLKDSAGKRALEIDVDATHGGYINKNGFYYTPDGQARGAISFIKPFEKPALAIWHTDGAPIGRSKAAAYIPLVGIVDSPNDNTIPKSKIRIKALITDQDAIEKILDGRYLTVSTGGTPKAVPTCSICGKSVDSEDCEHMRGEKYEDKLCFWYIGEMDYKEFTFVNTPADVSSDHAAGVVSIRLVEDGAHISDSLVIDNTIAATVTDSVKTNITCKSCNKAFEVEVAQDSNECPHCKTAVSKDGEVLEKKGEVEKTGGQPMDSKDLEAFMTILQDAKITIEDIKKLVSKIVDSKITVDETLALLDARTGDSKDAEIVTLKTTITQTQDELTKLKSDIQQKDSEFTQANAKIVDLTNANRKLLAEKIMDLSIITKRPSVVKIIAIADKTERDKKYNEMVDDLMKRTTESLNTAIVDLSKDVAFEIEDLQKIGDPSLKGADKTVGEKKTKKSAKELLFSDTKEE